MRSVEGLDGTGLRSLGAFHGTPEDGLPGEGTLVLLGPDRDFWSIFQGSAEYQDGAPDPLDRWSKRVLSTRAEALGGTALFPFGGPPYHPFYTWALKSGQAFASPIGFLVHRELGLMVSYRGAIFLPQALEIPAPSESPCDSCPARPCTTACPVGAFREGYDLTACHGYLDSPEGQDCMSRGCAARRACPVGQGQRQDAQSAFHMAAFHTVSP